MHRLSPRKPDWDPVAHWIRSKLLRDVRLLWILWGLVLFFVLDKVLLPIAVGSWNIDGGVRSWCPDLEALQVGLISFPFLSFYFLRLDHTLAEIWDGLASTGVFPDDEFQRIRGKASEAMASWWWTGASLLLTVAGGLLAYFELWQRKLPWWGGGPVPADWWGPDWLYDTFAWSQRVLAVLLVCYISYALAQIVLREFGTMYQLHRLLHDLGKAIEVRPFHPDDAGGFGAIGQHTARFTACLLILGLFIVMGSLLPFFRSEEAAAIVNTRLFWSWILYLSVLLLVYRYFIHEPHSCMTNARDRAVLKITEQIEELLKRKNTGSREDDAEQLSALKDLREWNMKNWPRWPIRAPLRRYLEVAVVLPALPSIARTAYDIVKELAA